MRFFASAGAVAIVAASWGTAAAALTLSQAATPAERPPSSYTKDVYIDSRGCVYVRASIGSTVNWVPRLTRDRETVVCGMTPTAAAPSVAAAPPPPPAPPPPVAATAPAAALTATPAVVTAPAAPAIPATATHVADPVSTLHSSPAPIGRTMEVSCPTDGSSARVRIGGDTIRVSCPPGMTRSVSYVVTHSNGSRSRLVANPAPGSAAVHVADVATTPGHVQPGQRVFIGGRAPGEPNTTFGHGYGITHTAPPLDPVPGVWTVPASTVTATRVAETYGGSRIPAGYRAAWDDGRLNPYRGPRTAYGDAQMATVLDTRTVPMKPAKPTRVVTTVVTTKSHPGVAPPPVASGARYVQVGAFGQASNAQNALAQIRSLGLTPATSRTSAGLTLVMAGPFASTADLHRALATLRSYYPDAYTRG